MHGFKYFDERDLLGLRRRHREPDRRRRPTPPRSIGDEDPDFAGGSYVIVQKYLHDLDAWNALPVEEQERVIGRTKLGDIELPDEVKPANSHVALNTITDDDGEERQIVRDNMPFGRVGTGEFGTYFIGYAATPDGDRADAAATCSSASRPATTTGSSTSPPRSPAAVLRAERGLPRRPTRSVATPRRRRRRRAR